MNNPFTEEKYPLQEEDSIIDLAKRGDVQAIEKIVKNHQSWIYNIVLRMVYDREETSDITQEILIKVIQKLRTFKKESKLSTWIYRIAVNHVLRMKKGRIEKTASSFRSYGNDLDSIKNRNLSKEEAGSTERKLLIEEAKVSCMSGMLLCLSRDQRIVFILGEIFSVSDAIGAEVTGVSRANFRKKLSRARKDLYNFMNEKCGLVNKDNPCRCSRKTKGFIEAGVVNPAELKFSDMSLKTIRRVAPKKSEEYEDYVEAKYAELYRKHKFFIPPNQESNLRLMFQDPKFKDIFDLSIP
ncbi:RNA polymerase sigma factor [Leptospira alstonii]|uniref:Sigma-70 region 2 n=2 Tax=Leptospira alstonii TaxID=28452 RepID=M6D4H7_9LEPT|nr:RNA polymerase sigma factor [Leptospira alstonii]EMJ97586.1 sigma-70 region 2 [Leptospira alstonii serovar Sichuan str. 79601]EQA79295.1 sigma-70 region 2 [Leptospira alstonii serovar Pingchang str. 80-412]